jgi:hypothetical protein
MTTKKNAKKPGTKKPATSTHPMFTETGLDQERLEALTTKLDELLREHGLLGEADDRVCEWVPVIGPRGPYLERRCHPIQK